MKKILLVCLLSLAGFSLFANEIIKGKITDAVSHEPLQGAVVKLKNDAKSFTVISGLDGSFIFKNIPEGSYEIEISYVGYQKKEEKIAVTAAGLSTSSFEMIPEGKKIDEVKVTAKTDKGSDLAAQTAERRADNILNAVSAKTIEVSPDLSVANVTQRVSGVSLQRSSNGEGQYAIVRGMEKRYNYTLVNGIKIPSPDNKNRYIPLDIFPADLLDRLEVTKALTPNMEGDAIGGVVNMVMKEAPSAFTVKANAGISFAQAFMDGRKFNIADHSASNNTSPRDRNGESYISTLGDFPDNVFKYSTKSTAAFNGGLSVGGRLFNKKLGIMLAASSQNSFRDAQSIFFKTETNYPDNSPKFTDIQRRNYSVEQKRTGLHSFWDYAIKPGHKINLYIAYLRLTEEEYRFSSDTNLVLGRVGPGTGRISNAIRSTESTQKIFNTTLKGEHQISKNFMMSWYAVYSKATGNQPDRASLELTTGVTKDAGNNLQQQPVYIDNSTFRDWARNSDEDKSGYLNFSYKSVISKLKIDWSWGGMYRDKDRKSSYDNYNLRPSPSPQEYKGNIDQNTFAIFNPQGTSTDALNYVSHEKVAAAYAMFKTEIKDLQIIAGARFENTDFDWKTAAPETVEGTTGTINYYDVLPSVHLKYKLGNKQYLRASYFSSISRPGFYEITPHVYTDPSSDYPERGNPYLKRTTAENFDLRYEYFPKGIDQLLAGVFYKRINNPIEYAIVNRGAGRTYYEPANFGKGSNFGFEFDVTKYVNSFGIKANYTYTHSEITTQKIHLFQKNVGGTQSNTQDTINQTRPLQGQSAHVANLSFLYKNSKRGIDAQLAMVYTGGRINTVSPYLNNDIWQKGFVQMDFSAEVRVIKRISVFAKINNILNTPYELETHATYTGTGVTSPVPMQEVGKKGFVRKDTYGANYLTGVRFKL